jgi:hypothetical protein
VTPENCRELRQKDASRPGGASEKRRCRRRTLENRRFLCASAPRWLKTGWLKIVQKKFKKKLTPLATSARFDVHTVNNNTQQHYK